MNLTQIDFSSLNKKAIIETAIQDAKAMIEAGEKNPLDAFVQLKRLEEYVTKFREELKAAAEIEAGKYSAKTFSAFNSEIQLQEGAGSRYDFSTTGDIEWERLNQEFESAKQAKEEREKFLKGITKPMASVDDETGEVYTIYPPQKTGGSTAVKVILK